MDVPRFPSPDQPGGLSPRAPGLLRDGWRAGLVALAVATLPLWDGAGLAQTGPVRCTTTIEAPLITPGQPPPQRRGPREVTRCGVVGTVSDLVEQRYYSYRSPFARGVDIIGQITDFFGVAMGGRDGSKVVGLGFPDQAIVWDGSAIENTTNILMEQQTQLVPRRTADLASPYSTSLRAGTSPSGETEAMAYSSNGMELR